MLEENLVPESNHRLDEDRDKFINFCVEHGLTTIETGKDLNARLGEITSKLTLLSDEGLFYQLKRWGEYARIGQKLVLDENIKIYSDLPEKDKEKPPLENFLPFYYETSLWRNDGKLGINEKALESEVPLELIPEGKPEFVYKAAEHARHKEGVLANIIWSTLVERFADRIGRDIFNGEPVIFYSTTLSEARNKSRPLPKEIKDWVERGLFKHIVTDYENLEFLSDPDKMADVVEVLLPSGKKDEAFQAYKKAWYPWFARGDMTPDREDVERRFKRELLELRRAIFSQAIEVFSKIDKPIHPKVEARARLVVVYGMSQGEGEKTFYGYKLMEKDEGKPLTNSVEALREIAIQEGLDLEPLKKRMEAKIKEWGLKRGHLANIVERALNERGEGKRIDRAARDGKEMWFIIEALFVTERGSDAPYRDKTVVEELIDFLRNG